MNDPAESDAEQESSSGDSRLSTRQQVIRFGAIAAILSAVLAVTANLSEIAGWFAPDETRELVEETQAKVETTGAKVDELLVLLRNQAAASGVNLDMESEAAIRNAVLAIVASGNAIKRAAVAQLEQGDVAAAAETISSIATEQASAVSQTGSAAAASWAEAGALFRTFDFDRASDSISRPTPAAAA